MKNVHPSRAPSASSSCASSTGNGEKYIRSFEGLEGRPWAVSGQLQNGKLAAQLLSPELDLAGKGCFVGDGLSLPLGEVGILHGQIGWRGSPPPSEGPIKRIQLRPASVPMDNPSATM